MGQSSTRELLDARSEVSLHAAPPFDPDYVHAVSQERRAISTPLSLATGTGYSIYKSAIIPFIKAARREVILVTCFWAPSVTRDEINEALKELSKKAIASSSKISVQICFSSSSLLRNMLLPTPKSGQNYPPAAWKKLGLPEPGELTGLNMLVIRKFFWPFGIIHSKYVIIDREIAIFPSCNVSWEPWFEVAVSIRGSVVEHLFSFHSAFWGNKRSSTAIESATEHGAVDLAAPFAVMSGAPNASTSLLPSPHSSTWIPHYLRPRAVISLCPCIPAASPNFSPTPLLKTTYHLLSTARSTIVILTPNLTEPAVLEALSQALERGVHVCVWTNRQLMTVEQLATAGTTTPNYIRKLMKRSREMRGPLRTFYFDDENGPRRARHGPSCDRETTPIKLHAKVTIVDGERILLGSGNMDAASWKTSQELGVLIESRHVVDEFKKQWKYGRLES